MEATYAKPGELVVRLPRGDGKADDVGGRFIDQAIEGKVKAIVASGGALTLRLATGEEADTLGHQGSSDTVVVIAGGDEDVEGHALALRFPTVKDAQEFQRRLLLTGVIAGALVVGVVGVNIGDSSQTATGAGTVGGATTSVQPRGANDDVGLMDASGAAISGDAQSTSRAADDDVGLMDPTGAGLQDDEPDPPQQLGGRFRGR